jgi:hypothetical protein
MRKIILKTSLTLVGLMFFSVTFAQFSLREAYGSPLSNEQIIGQVRRSYVVRNNHPTDAEVFGVLLEQARRQHPNRNIALRYFNPGISTMARHLGGVGNAWWEVDVNASAQVVEIIPPPPPPQVIHVVQEPVSPPPPPVQAPPTREQAFANAMNRALMNVNEGARVSLGQVQVPTSLNSSAVRDFFVDMLLEKGFRVVARAQLERLLEEQDLQHGGGFNERTIARADNLTAVGFFLDVRVTDNSVRVRAINVSTGEYVGNATVEF